MGACAQENKDSSLIAILPLVLRQTEERKVQKTCNLTIASIWSWKMNSNLCFPFPNFKQIFLYLLLLFSITYKHLSKGWMYMQFISSLGDYNFHSFFKYISLPTNWCPHRTTLNSLQDYFQFWIWLVMFHYIQPPCKNETKNK